VKVAVVPSWYPTQDDPVRGIFFVRHVDALRREHDVVLVSPRRGAGLLPFAAEVARKVRAARPDVVHAHVAVPAGAASLLARLAGGPPVVLTEHSGPLTRLYGRSPLRRAIVRRIFATVDALGVPSDALLPELRALGVGRELFVVPNPLPDLPGRRDGPPLSFVAAGLMDDRTKGFEYLLAAWRAFVRDYPGARLTIVGDGALRGEYEAGAPASVTFVGALSPDETLETLAGCDAFVSASVRESFGAVATEAAALGKPLVATAVGVVPSLVDETTGVIVPPRDAEALADGLRSYAGRRGAFDRELLRRRALERFGADAVCRATTAIYRQVTV
jgi:glycosyltransferase involved in cell wall biosynthesis